MLGFWNYLHSNYIEM